MPPTAALSAAIGPLVLAQSQATSTPASPAAAAPALVRIREETTSIASWAVQIAADWGLRLLGVILVLIGAWVVAVWARKTVYRALNRPRFDQTLVRFISNSVRWAALVLGVVAALSIFGIAPTSLAAVVGATGLAIGLALQGSLSNLAAGIMLLLLRPFKVGDVVNLAGQIGKVDDIELFNTKVDTLDNRRLVIPNGQIFGSVIENLTHHDQRRIDINVGVEYAADIDVTRQALLRATASIPGVLKDPAPDAVVTGLGASSVDWQLRVWCKTADFGVVRQSTIRAAKLALEEAGISIPFPQMELWNRGAPAAPRSLTDQAASRLARFPDHWPKPAAGEPDPD